MNKQSRSYPDEEKSRKPAPTKRLGSVRVFR
jgi:hypothetical protein